MKGFYELEKLRQGILGQIEPYEIEIKAAQELAKTYKKGSEERKIANAKVKEIKEDIKYIHLNYDIDLHHFYKKERIFFFITSFESLPFPRK